MNFDSYQEWTREFAKYSGHTYPLLALPEEVGELLGKLAKYERDVRTNSSIDTEERLQLYDALLKDVTKEAGDVLWQLARLLDDRGIKLSDCVAVNVDKLESRKARGKLGGSGDDR